MDSSSVTQFLLSLGVDDDSIIVDEDRQWIRCSCPLAPWTHKSGKDSSPSFGITIREESEGSQSVANCKTCGVYSGDKEYWGLEQLLHKIWLLSGEYPKAAAQVLTFGRKFDDTENFQIRLREDKPYEEPVKPLSVKVRKKYPKLQYRDPGDSVAIDVISYLHDFRNIPEWMLYYYGIRYNVNNNTMIFPLTGMDGKIYAMRERTCSRRNKKIWTVSSKTSELPNEIFPRITQSGAMFGLSQFDRNYRVATLCEGEIDAMSLRSMGAKNPVASATNQITASQAMSMFPYIDRLIHVPDAEVSGAVSVKRIMKFFQETEINIRVIDCGLVTIEDGLTLKKRPAKDANDLESEDQFEYLMEHWISPEEFLEKYK